MSHLLRTDRARFVILAHDHPFLHWDLLLEAPNVLRSWRLLQPPQTGDWIAAEQLPNHRKIYLDYEGPVSGNRGSVQRVASGQFLETERRAPDVQESLQLFGYAMAQLAERRVLRGGEIQWRFTQDLSAV